MNKLFKGVFLILLSIGNTTYSRDRTPEIVFGCIGGLKILTYIDYLLYGNPNFEHKNELKFAKLVTVTSLAAATYGLINNNNETAAILGLVSAISNFAEDQIILPVGQQYPDYEDGLSRILFYATLAASFMASCISPVDTTKT